MHSLRCLRIMQMRTIVIFGLLSSSLTFVLLIFHTRVQDHHSDSYFPSGEHERKVFNVDSIRDLKSQKDNSNRPIFDQNGRQGKQDQFVFHQFFVPVDVNKSNHGPDWVDMIRFFSNDTRPPLSVTRLLKYCNLPHSQEEEGEGLVPKPYNLVSVQVVIRHGDRSPIYRLPFRHASLLSCMLDTSQYSHLPKVVAYPSAMANAYNKPLQSQFFQKWPMYPSESTCGEGQLTGRGAVQHILNGMHLSQRYLLKHRLFPAMEWSRNVLVHTTETSRTYQSALALIFGLVPDFDVTKANLKISPFVNFCEERVFGSSCQCPALNLLRAKAEEDCKVSEEVKKSNIRYKYALDYVSYVLKVAPNSIPGPSSLMDGLSGHTCHSQPYPCSPDGKCITSRLLESVWKTIDIKSSCMAQNPSYVKFCRASMHGLLYRIARNFRASSQNGTNAKFHLYSGHDTTLSPLIVGLGIKDNVWPGYAHRIIFEMYTNTNNKRNFIRVLQNGKVVTHEVIFCQNKTLDHGLCDFDNFLQYLQEKDLKSFCESIQSSDRTLEFNEF